MQGFGHGGCCLSACSLPSLSLCCLCAMSRPHAPAGASTGQAAAWVLRGLHLPCVSCASAAPRHPGMGWLSLTAFPKCL